LLLTASVDKSLRFTDVRTQRCVLHYTTPSSVWSCAWRSDNTNWCFCGLDDGMLLLIDVRQTRSFALRIPAPKSDTKPSISCIKYIPNGDDNVNGIIASSLIGGTLFYDDKKGYERSIILPGVSTSVAFESNTRKFLSTQRSTDSIAIASHSLFSLRRDGDILGIHGGISSLVGFDNSRVLSRSAMFQCGAHRNTYVASADEKSGAVLIWDTASSEIAQRLSESNDLTLGSIFDIRFNQDVLGVMGANGLLLYRNE
jgi:WD40 repeat protein